MIPEKIYGANPLKVVSRAATHVNTSQPLQSASVVALPFLQHIPFNAILAARVFEELGLSSYCPANYLRYMVRHYDEQHLRNELDKITNITLTPSFQAASEVVCNNVAEYPVDLYQDACILEDITAVSKIGNGSVYLVVYNASLTTPKEFFVKVPLSQTVPLTQMKVLYGFDACGAIPVNNYRYGDEYFKYIKLYLKPLHVVILKN